MGGHDSCLAQSLDESVKAKCEGRAFFSSPHPPTHPTLSLSRPIPSFHSALCALMMLLVFAFRVSIPEVRCHVLNFVLRCLRLPFRCRSTLHLSSKLYVTITSLYSLTALILSPWLAISQLSFLPRPIYQSTNPHRIQRLRNHDNNNSISSIIYLPFSSHQQAMKNALATNQAR